MKPSPMIHATITALLCVLAASCDRTKVAPAATAVKTEVSTAETMAVPHPKWSLPEFHACVEEGKVPVLDVRPPEEFQRGHVPGAINLPLWDFANDYERLRSKLDPHREKLVVVYCSSTWCETSDLVQLRLITLGFKHVATVPGGWAEWQQAGLPVGKLEGEGTEP